MPKLKISVTELLSIIRFGLENLDTGRGKKETVVVKDLRVMNLDVLLCEFQAYSSQSVDIKGEMYSIMRFFGAFFKDDVYEGIAFNRYAVRAYNERGEEVMWAISSRASVVEQDPIEWMKSTIFQDNSTDFRLGTAKRMISEIENVMRSAVVDLLSKRYGTNWWEAALDNKLGRKVKQRYLEQFGIACNDGSVLIQHTLLSQLKDLVLTHWTCFKHLLPSRQEFETLMTRLNELRREEAHNREITRANIKDLETIYFKLLPAVSEAYPNFVPHYLIDNWRIKIRSVMNIAFTPPFSNVEIEGESNPLLRLTNCVHTIKYIISHVDDQLLGLGTVIVPVQKQVIHAKLIEVLTVHRNLQNERMQYLLANEPAAIELTMEKLDQHKLVLDAFSQKYVISES